MTSSYHEKQDLICRLARPSDIEQIVDIYIECVPNRAAEVFGNRKAFIRDYLLFYLSWDPEGNWVCADGDTILGCLMAPVHYSPLKAVFQHGQILWWTFRLIRGQYGFPLQVVKQFFAAGFSFNPHPAIQKRWGMPYIHLLAVKVNCQRSGIGSRLIRTMLEDHRRKGVVYVWGLAPSWAPGVVHFYTKLGARVEAVLGNGDVVFAYSSANQFHD